jgi:hypothetical protein
MPPFALTDHQLELVMMATAPFDPAKRAVLMGRMAAHLRVNGVRHPTDTDVNRGCHGGTAAGIGGLAPQIPFRDKRREDKTGDRMGNLATELFQVATELLQGCKSLDVEQGHDWGLATRPRDLEQPCLLQLAQSPPLGVAGHAVPVQLFVREWEGVALGLPC